MGVGDHNIQGDLTVAGTVDFPGGAADTDRVANLNADQVDGIEGAGIVQTSGDQTITGTKTFSAGVIGVQEQNGGRLLKKVIEIGDWNMDATAYVEIAHGLTLANIRGIKTIIRNDADGVYGEIHYNAGSGAAGYLYVDATNVRLGRNAGGAYDNSSYDSTSYNRGWITIEYVG